MPMLRQLLGRRKRVLVLTVSNEVRGMWLAFAVGFV